MMDITVGEVGARKALSEGSMVDITEGIVGAGELSRGLDWGLGGSGRGLDEARLVDLVIGGQQCVVTVGVGGAEGLQVIRQLASSQTGHTQGDDEGQHHEKLPITVTYCTVALNPCSPFIDGWEQVWTMIQI